MGARLHGSLPMPRHAAARGSPPRACALLPPLPLRGPRLRYRLDVFSPPKGVPAARVGGGGGSGGARCVAGRVSPPATHARAREVAFRHAPRQASGGHSLPPHAHSCRHADRPFRAPGRAAAGAAAGCAAASGAHTRSPTRRRMPAFTLRCARRLTRRHAALSSQVASARGLRSVTRAAAIPAQARVTAAHTSQLSPPRGGGGGGSSGGVAAHTRAAGPRDAVLLREAGRRPRAGEGARRKRMHTRLLSRSRPRACDARRRDARPRSARATPGGG